MSRPCRMARSTSGIRLQDDEAGSARAHLHAAQLQRMTSRLPVLYLLHGGDGEDSVWTAFGRAHVILDNLIAEKTIPPMVVVMPNGYAYGWDAVVAAEQQQADFQRDLIDDLIPFVQAPIACRAVLSEASRAGGPVTRRRSDAQHRPSSPGSLQPPRRLQRRQQQPARGVQGCCRQPQEGEREARCSLGRMRHRRVRDAWGQAPGQLFTASGLEHTFRTTGGEHTWIVWRQYLREFAPLLSEYEAPPPRSSSTISVGRHLEQSPTRSSAADCQFAARELSTALPSYTQPFLSCATLTSKDRIVISNEPKEGLWHRERYLKESGCRPVDPYGIAVILMGLGDTKAPLRSSNRRSTEAWAGCIPWA